MTLAFRPAADHDQTFIVDAWVSSYRTAHAAGMISMATWRAVMWPEVERVLRLPNTRTFVAYETDETDHVADLYGFISVDTAAPPPIVWYVYTKEAYRRGGNGRLWDGHGLARKLFAAAGVDPTSPFVYGCKTSVVAELSRLRKIPSAKWDPVSTRFDNPRREREQPAADQDRPRHNRRASTEGPIIERRRPR